MIYRTIAPGALEPSYEGENLKTACDTADQVGGGVVYAENGKQVYDSYQHARDMLEAEERIRVGQNYWRSSDAYNGY
jgi:hypothetical protein